MADPVDPSAVPPPPPSPGPTVTGSPGSDPSTMDLPPNIAAAIACLPLVGGIIFYLLEKRNEFVRFYAMQSIIFGGAWFLFGIASTMLSLIFAGIPGVGWILVVLFHLLTALINIAFLVIWIIATIKAFTGVRWEIPYIGPMARKQVQGVPVGPVA